MITQIETLNYRSLRYIRQPLTPFQVLIGPNASGKSTFLDVVAFLADVVREKEGVSGAVEARAPDMRDLTWMRRGDMFELAVEAAVPHFVQRSGGNVLSLLVAGGYEPGDRVDSDERLAESITKHGRPPAVG